MFNPDNKQQVKGLPMKEKRRMSSGPLALWQLDGSEQKKIRENKRVTEWNMYRRQTEKCPKTLMTGSEKDDEVTR